MSQLDKNTDFINIIEWRIVPFSECNVGVSERLESTTVKVFNFFNTRWLLHTYPKGREDTPEFLSCFLIRDDQEKVGPERIIIDFEFSLVTFDGVQTFNKIGTGIFKRESSLGFDKFVKLEDIYHRKEFLLQYDTLTIQCKLRLALPSKKPVAHQIIETKFPVSNVSMPLVLYDFRSIGKRNPKIVNLRGINDFLSLKIFVNKDESENAETSESFLHIAITKKEAVTRPVHVSCRVKLLNKKLDYAIHKKVSHIFPETDEPEELILPHFIDINNLGDDCIQNNTLNLHFDFIICDKNPITQLVSDISPLELRKDPKETTLLKDLVELLKTQKFSDVTLRIGDKMFPAHQSILAARSLRFDEIVTSLSKEKTSCENRIVEIDDIDENTMALMLKFIYTDELEDMNDERSVSVYVAARKYQIPSLQHQCVKSLKKTLSFKTVYKVLPIAVEYNDSQLKMEALVFILQHYLHAFLTPEWQEFSDEHEKLAD